MFIIWNSEPVEQRANLHFRKTVEKIMCSSKIKASTSSTNNSSSSSNGSPRINGRPVLQPTCNVVPTQNSSVKKPLPPLPPAPKAASTEEAPPRKATEVVTLRNTPAPSSNLERRSFSMRSKSFNGRVSIEGRSSSSESYPSSLIMESPGSIAGLRREQVAQQQAQRKMRIAHYGRSKSAKFESRIVPLVESHTTVTPQEKRCSFITANSDPLYVSYHDEEWGLPIHDDNMLFELLVLSGAQVGSDWTSILRKRQLFSKAFSGYNPEIIAALTDKQIISLSTEHGIDVSRVRGAVDNAKRILEIRKDFGSFDKYIWGFVNYKPLSPQYKFGHKMPVKTSKSECISKDMVRRGFRSVGPTVVHSFMQAAGLTNDHLITCYRHQNLTRLN